MKPNKKHIPQEDLEKEDKMTTENTTNEENSEDLSTSILEAEMEEEIKLLKTENNKLKEDFLRAYADAENTKRRCTQEIEKNNKYAISSFAKNLLSVADNLERALKSVSEDKHNDNEKLQNLLTGIQLTDNELMKVFDKFGIQKMTILNTKFDPNFHQAIQEVEDQTKPTGTIIAELQTGYMINDRILREAMVVVTKGGK